MASVIDVTAIVIPAPGKHELVKEELTKLAAHVKEHETDVLKYIVFEQVNAEETNVFIVQELYANEEALKAHTSSPYFLALGKRLQEETLLAAAPDIKNQTILSDAHVKTEGFEN